MGRGLQKKVEFFFFDAGGGHRSAALALKASAEKMHPEWDVQLVNLMDILLPLDPIHFMDKKHKATDIYNEILKNDLTFGAEVGLRALQNTIRIGAPIIRKFLEHYWEKTNPDLVVSLVPNFNKPLFDALKKVCPRTPYVTIMTDIADFQPHFWQEPQDQYIICGSSRALAQAKRLGAYEPDKIFLTSGMILKPQFYVSTPFKTQEERQAAREKEGLEANWPTAIIMFGGNGSRNARKIVESLAKAKLKIQSIVMCGNNEKLYKELQNVPHCVPVSFTQNVPYYMFLSDIFIGKPGPGSLSEAIHLGLSVIVKANQSTLPQERYNATWVLKNKLGTVFKRNRDVAGVVKMVLQTNLLSTFKENACKRNNRAVFEIPSILNDILKRS